jgi:hypothetical protein
MLKFRNDDTTRLWSPEPGVIAVGDGETEWMRFSLYGIGQSGSILSYDPVENRATIHSGLYTPLLVTGEARAADIATTNIYAETYGGTSPGNVNISASNGGSISLSASDPDTLIMLSAPLVIINGAIWPATGPTEGQTLVAESDGQLAWGTAVTEISPLTADLELAGHQLTDGVRYIGWTDIPEDTYQGAWSIEPQLTTSSAWIGGLRVGNINAPPASGLVVQADASIDLIGPTITATAGSVVLMANEGGSVAILAPSIGLAGAVNINGAIWPATAPTEGQTLIAGTDGQLEWTTVESEIAWDDITGKPTLFSGSYTDLTDKPTIPDALNDFAVGGYISVGGILTTAILQAETARLTFESLGDQRWVSFMPTMTPMAGKYARLASAGGLNTRIEWEGLSNVARTGSYADLSNKPDLSGYATTTALDALDVRVDTLEAGGGGGGLTELIEDTSPQLGGNLDLNGFGLLGGTATITYNDGTNRFVSTTTVMAPTVRANMLISHPSANLTITADAGSVSIGSPNNVTIAATGDLTLGSVIWPATLGDVGDILVMGNDSTLEWSAVVAPAWSTITGKPTFAAVATSGAYGDLTGTPSIPSTLDALADVTISTPLTNQVIRYNGTAWTNQTMPAGTELTGLSDVEIDSPIANQVLKYDGGTWRNAVLLNGATSLNGLSDVDLTASATGHILRYNGTAYVNTPLVIDLDDATGVLPLNKGGTGTDVGLEATRVVYVEAGGNNLGSSNSIRVVDDKLVTNYLNVAVVNGVAWPEEGELGQVLTIGGTGGAFWQDPVAAPVDIHSNPILASGATAISYNSETGHIDLNGYTLSAGGVVTSTINADTVAPFTPGMPVMIDYIQSQFIAGTAWGNLSSGFSEIPYKNYVGVERDDAMTLTWHADWADKLSANFGGADLTLFVQNTGGGAITWPGNIIWLNGVPDLTEEVNGFDVIRIVWETNMFLVPFGYHLTSSGTSLPDVGTPGDVLTNVGGTWTAAAPTGGGGGGTVDDAAMMLNAMIFG